MSVQRCAELTDLDSSTAQGLDEAQREKPLGMPKEYDGKDALEMLYSEKASHSALPTPPGSELMKSGWPWKGSIEFKNVSMRYSPSAPLVLKNVTASVPAGTTLGIVGRTGSCSFNVLGFSLHYLILFAPIFSHRGSPFLAFFSPLLPVVQDRENRRYY
jgi:ABC-type multidrug transport system fused ATPase/permease subunit